MQLQQRLATCGMGHLYESVLARMERLQSAGLNCTPEELLTASETHRLLRMEADLRSASGVGVTNEKELSEYNRLVVLLARESGEAVSWLRKQPIQRLRQMMEMLEF